MNDSDRLYSVPRNEVEDFVFNEEVVRVFPDMIKRSVPGYPAIVENIGVIAAQFAQPQTVLYDLGCSLGAVSQALRRHVRQRDCRVIGVDSSSAMIERCREYLQAQDAMYQELLPVEAIEHDILDLTWQPCSVIAMNFTLQFIPPEKRLPLMKKLRRALVPGGALILSEKTRFSRPEQQELLTDLHIGFKRANGYSELEIAQKRTALENVMIIDTVETHQQRLAEAGFQQTTVWFQCFNFVSMIALP